jgi:hypothetical protein
MNAFARPRRLAMPLPFVEAWKALALRVAERLARPAGPEAPAVHRVKATPKAHGPVPKPGGAQAPAKHRSGRRHG